MKYFISNQLYTTIYVYRKQHIEKGHILWGDGSTKNSAINKLNSKAYHRTRVLIDLFEDKKYSLIIDMLPYTDILKYSFIPDICVYNPIIMKDIKCGEDRYLLSWQFSNKALHYIIRYHTSLLTDKCGLETFLLLESRFISYEISLNGGIYIPWDIISENFYQYDDSFIIKYQDKLNWNHINRSRRISFNIIDNCSAYIDWDHISYKANNEMIEKYQDKLNWDIISISHSIETIDKKYYCRLDWDLIIRFSLTLHNLPTILKHRTREDIWRIYNIVPIANISMYELTAMLSSIRND